MIAQVKIGESGLGLLEGSSSLKEHQIVALESGPWAHGARTVGRLDVFLALIQVNR